MGKALSVRNDGGIAERIAYRVTESCDPEQHSRALAGWDHVYEQVECAPFHGRLTEVRLGSVHISRDEIRNPIGYRGATVNDALTFIVFLPTQGTAFCRGRPVSANRIVKFPSDYSHRAICNGPTDTITITADESAFLDYAISVTDGAFDRQTLRRSLYVDDPHTVRTFLNSALSIMEQTSSDPGLLENELWRTRTVDVMRQFLLELLQAELAMPLKLPPASTRAYIVDKAIEYMEAHLSDALVTARVCDAIRVCPRTLRYSFEEIVGVSPKRYLLALRLHAARRALCRGNAENSIHRIAQQCGFNHMGRFAQCYRVAFGELPSEAIRN